MDTSNILRHFFFMLFGCLLFAACQNEPPADNSKSSDPNLIKSEKQGNATINYSTHGDVLNVYTYRNNVADQKTFKLFEDKYKVKVNVFLGDADELIDRMIEEGDNCPADVLITTDAARLYRAKASGVIRPLISMSLKEKIPDSYRDYENYWIALTKRARVIAYSKDKVKPSELSTYENLTDKKWKGRILVGSSDNIYNQSMLASFIMHDGGKKVEEWAAGIVNNLARPPKGNDSDQIKAIAQGEGDIALVNTYSYGTMLNSEDSEERKAAKQVALYFPKNSQGKTHVNISGIALAQHSPNVGNAVRFMEFVVSEPIQKLIAEGSFEYPVNPNVEPSPLLKSWGNFEDDDLYFEKLGENNRKAKTIFNEVGWK